MFSEASVSHSVHKGVCLWGLPPGMSAFSGRSAYGDLHAVLTSSGGHCSGRYASYWNAFLFYDIYVHSYFLSSFRVVSFVKQAYY